MCKWEPEIFLPNQLDAWGLCREQAHSSVLVRMHSVLAEHPEFHLASVSTTLSWWWWPRPKSLIQEAFVIWHSCQHTVPSTLPKPEGHAGGDWFCRSPVVISASTAGTWWRTGKCWCFPSVQDPVFLRHSVRSLNSLAMNGECSQS